MDLRGLECCGIKEGYNCQYYMDRDGPAGTLYHMITLNGFNNCGATIFTEAGIGADYAKRLATFITLSNLGSVIELPEFYNPNSKNKVRAFFWIRDDVALGNWYADYVKSRKIV